MAPRKKKHNDEPPKDILKRAQKPKKPTPKTVKVRAVALDQLQASSGISPKQAKTPPKQTNSPDTVMKPVRKRTRDTKKNVNKTTQKHSEDDSVATQKHSEDDSVATQKHSEDDSVATQEQLDIPVKIKNINKTTNKYNVDDSLALQKQLVIPITRMYVNKTTEKYSVDDSGTPQEQIYTPVTGKHVNKTTNNYSLDDSVAPKEQLHSPVTRNYANKTRNYVNKIKKHSVDDSVALQEQLLSPVTRKHVSKTTKKHSVDDSAAPQEQLHSPVKRKYIYKTTKKHSEEDSVTLQEQSHSPVTKKYDNKTTEKHVDDSVAPQEKLHSPVKRKYIKKTAKIHSVDNSVTPQEQLHSPVKRKYYIHKTTKKHSEDDSVTQQEQSHSPVTRKYDDKTTEKHVDDSVAPQEQLHSSVKRKYIKKTAKIRSVYNSLTPQEQLHSPVKRKYYIHKTTKKHSEDDSVTQQEQSHSPVTRKYDDKTTEIHVDDSVAPQEQLHSPIKRKYINKTAKIHSVDNSFTPQEQLHSPVKRRYIHKTKKKHSEDDSVTQQEQSHSPVTIKYDNKTTEKQSVDYLVTPRDIPVTRKHVNKTTEKHIDDSVTQQEQLHSPVTGKYDNKTRVVHSVDDSETVVQEHMKKRPGPKSRTIFEVKKKLVTPVTKSIEEPVVIKEQKSIKSANISPDNSSDILSKEGLATTEGCDNVAAIPIIRPRETPKGSALTKSKILNEKEIQNGTPVLVKVIENISTPPQSNNRPNSVNSNTSNLTWTKDISTKSSISSGTYNSVTVTSSVPINNKLEQLENPEQQNVKDDNLKQRYLREISRNESSSSDRESSSAASSSSDWELRGINTIPKPRLTLSDENIKFCRRKIKYIYKDIEDIISTLCPHYDDLCCDSDIPNSFNFDRDLEEMMQQVNNSEKLKHHRTADFSAQNGTEIRSLEESRRSSYEESLSDTSSPERYRLRQKTVHNVSETEFAKPCLARRVCASSSRDTSINLPEQLFSNMNQVEASPTDSFKTFTSNNYSYEPFDRTHDDDDSLSLYAESISGLNSSRLDSGASVSNVSLHDVYVPEYSPTACMREKYIYKPTKIQEHRSNPGEESTEDDEIVTNADEEAKKISRACASSSGSIANNKTKASGLLEDSNRTSAIAEDSIKRSEAQISSQPRRLFSSYKSINPVRSSLYRGVCFFFIASQCKKISCRFIHAIVNIDTFKLRLQILDDDTLIAEYLLMCGYESLKRKYYLLFVEECNRRKATRILFEMAIDLGLEFISIDEDIRVEVLETALLHLNTISIDACDDLLQVEHEGTMMCDALLSCMANSQNFSQFKPAFVKLANLMCELNRPVDIEVASSILERVCILPGEDLLARGMLALMENTDVSIFENNLACSFELQLANNDSDVHAAYLLAKKAALEGRLAQPDETYPTTPPITPCVVLNAPRQTRPDFNNVHLHEPLPPVNSTPRRFVEPRLPRWR